MRSSALLCQDLHVACSPNQYNCVLYGNEDGMVPSYRATLILLCGGAILMLSLGTLQTFGLFLQPLTSGLGWGRETFAFSFALQNLI